MKLTIEQTDLLFDVTEHHLKWYVRYYPDVPDFYILLELNHIKLKNSFSGDSKYTEEDVIDKLIEFKIDYINMLINTDDIHKENKKK